MMRHADSVVTDDMPPLPCQPGLFSYLPRQRAPRAKLRTRPARKHTRRIHGPLGSAVDGALTVLPACACDGTNTCLEHTTHPFSREWITQDNKENAA